MKKYLIINILITLVLFMMITTSCSARKNLEPRVKLETTYGNIVVKLYNETPLHRDNFLKLVDAGFYDGLLFHRVIADFMIQSGDPDSRNAQPGQALGRGDVGYRLPAEIVFPQRFHKRGALAAARQGDHINPERKSSGCQFYIVQGRIFTNQELDMMESSRSIEFTEEQRYIYSTIGGTPHLDGEYTVFGEVIEGLDVVEKISRTQTGRHDRPIEDIKIISARRVR